MPPEMTDPGTLITFRHLGFENFDFQVLLVMAGRVGIAAALGAIVAVRWWRRFMIYPFERAQSGAQVLISVAGALMTAVIGNNVALAFALVGLGGFIRFRSGIKDPREAGVMFVMIGIGMACGMGMMPVALTATLVGIVLLVILDFSERFQQTTQRRRIRLSSVKDPRTLEPLVRRALEDHVTVKGSRIAQRREEVIIDIMGSGISTAGEVVDILEGLDIHVPGDVACEEI